jgi:hypothetical protein
MVNLVLTLTCSHIALHLIQTFKRKSAAGTVKSMAPHLFFNTWITITWRTATYSPPEDQQIWRTTAQRLAQASKLDHKTAELAYIAVPNVNGSRVGSYNA